LRGGASFAGFACGGLGGTGGMVCFAESSFGLGEDISSSRAAVLGCF